MELRQKIVLVDDDITSLSIGKSVLGAHYDLITVPTAQKLKKSLEVFEVDLILLDIDLLEETGIGVISKLKQDKRYATLPIVLLSARDDSESIGRGFEAGAADYITKPYEAKILLNTVKHHLALQQQRKLIDSFDAQLHTRVKQREKSMSDLQTAVLSTVMAAAEVRGLPNVDFVGTAAINTYFPAVIAELERLDFYKEDLEPWEPSLVIASAQLHDIGKIIIDERILHKPGKLTTVEFAQMQRHTVLGSRLIEHIDRQSGQHKFVESAKLFAESHHERWDGTGYPLGIKGTQIPLQGRLMAIIDVYSALISNRSYKKAVSHQEARRIIAQESSTHFDPTLVEIFLSVSAH